MHVAQRADHLEFDDDLVLDQQVGRRFPDDHVVVRDDNSPLRDGAEPALSHLAGRGISESFSTIPRPSALAVLKAHPLIRSVTGANNRASPSSTFIPLIRLKKRALASAQAPSGAQMSYAACCYRR
jgi:hypothetical protein